MAKVCAITGKTSLVAGNYSSRVRATQYNPTGKTRRQPNLQRRKIFVPELDQYVIITVSAHGLRTIQKKGAYRALKDAGVI
jgi:large subunit ribosomal protein L28